MKLIEQEIAEEMKRRKSSQCCLEDCTRPKHLKDCLCKEHRYEYNHRKPEEKIRKRFSYFETKEHYSVFHSKGGWIIILDHRDAETLAECVITEAEGRIVFELPNGNQQSLAQFIMGTKYARIEHINNNCSDFRKSNLKIRKRKIDENKES